MSNTPYFLDYSAMLTPSIWMPTIWTPADCDVHLNIFPFMMTEKESAYKYNKLMRRYEALVRKTEELKRKDEDAKRKDEEAKRKAEEAKRIQYEHILYYRSININNQLISLQDSYPQHKINYIVNIDGSVSFSGFNIRENIFLGTYSF